MKVAFKIFLLVFVPVYLSAQTYVPELKDKRMKVKPVIPVQTYAFNISDVQLLNSPFKHAMQMDSAYLLFLKPDRLLNRFYKNAGLPTKDSVYGGWESEGLSGHTLGHYISACAIMYASSGNNEFLNRINYIIDELERCQQARHTGYIGAIPNEDSIFGKVAIGEIKSSGFDLNGGWSPWYTVHKLMAGLVDAYLFAENKKALKLVTGMADWTYNTVNHLSDSLRLKMLNCEYGGMNDVLANIYAITGIKKYLGLSYKFYDEFVMGKLAQRIDPMPGKHSNTNVPKAIGSARQYQLTGNERDKTIASFFWETMAHNHSYVIGGNSNYEYCGPAGKLNDRLSDNTCETCNTYNMLKLTQQLFTIAPSASLMDYYEKALYNHILASQNPINGMTTYFVPLRMGAKKVFSDSTNTFTCCVGSGMENHTKYATQIYSHDGNNTLFVNLFIPSVLQWKEKKVIIQQRNFIPEQKEIMLVVSCVKPTSFSLKIRKPFWVRNNPVLYINGKPVDTQLSSEGYLTITRQWNNKDRVTADFSMDIYSEAMPDNANRIAFKYGPVVLAGKLGKQMPDPIYGTPVLLTNDKNINKWIKPAVNENIAFEINEVAKPLQVKLVPFYQVYDEYYSVYWDYFTNEEWTSRQTEYEAEKKRVKEIEEKTIDNFRIGEMQPERDHNLVAGDRSYIDEALGRPGREARSGSYFVFDMKVEAGIQNNLLLTYIGDDKDRKFDIKIDGQLIETENWPGGQTSRFYDKVYPIPQSITANKQKISIRIEANYKKTAGRIFAARIIK